MARAQYCPCLPPSATDIPNFLQLARAIAADIQARRQRPGAPLPGSPALSRALGVHRNTVLAALAELSQQGWIQSEPRRGTFVAESFPETRLRRFAKPHTPAPVELELPEPPAADPFPPPAADVLPLIG